MSDERLPKVGPSQEDLKEIWRMVPPAPCKASGDDGAVWDHRPQCSDPKFGPEPSIRQMVRFYYGQHGMIDPDADTDAYLAALAASRPTDAGADLRSEMGQIVLICEEAGYACANCSKECGPVKAVNEIHAAVTAALATPKPPVDEAMRERCAQVADDAAEGARVLHNAAAEDRDRDGILVHGETWRVAQQIAAAIRNLTGDGAGA